MRLFKKRLASASADNRKPLPYERMPETMSLVDKAYNLVTNKRKYFR
jgi:hypothetical protein